MLHRFLNDPDFTRIGNGGARGGAKSGGGRRCLLLRRLEYPNTTGLILRRTFPELYRSHIVKLFEEFPELMQSYNHQNHVLNLPEGSRLFFGSAQREGDLANFYSAEFSDIMVDEAQEFAQGELEKLQGSNRCTSNPNITPKMLYTFMPGMSEAGLPPRGLHYLKRVFVDKKLEGPEALHKWAFIRTFAWDNLEWCRAELGRDGVGNGRPHDEDDPDACECLDCTFYSWPEQMRRDYFIERTDFGLTLSSLTDVALREAWLEGKFDQFEGQYFQQWSKERHVITRADALKRMKPWHRYSISGDWGYEHPHSIYLHCVDERDHILTFGEQWGRQMHETALGQAIGKLAEGHKFGTFVFSWDAGKLSKRSNPKFPKSISQMISDALPKGVPKPQPADSSPGSRIARARLTGALLDRDMWQVTEDCPKLIECMPTLLRDPDNPEDVLKVDWSENGIGDDTYDGATTGLQHLVGSVVKPDSVVLAEKLAKVRKQFAAPQREDQPAIEDFFAKFKGTRA